MGLIDLLLRSGSRGAALAVAAAVLAVPAPAFVQKGDVLEQEAARAQQRLRLIRDLEGMLKGAEAARLRGECKTVAQIHSYFHSKFEGLPAGMVELMERLRERIDAIAFAECPPGSGTPSVQRPLEGHEDILDEIGDDTGATQTGLPPRPVADPPRTAPPPPPRKPEEVHVPPKPVADPKVYEPTRPTPDSSHGQDLSQGAEAMILERRNDEARALAALEALRLKGDCAAYLAERERLRSLLKVLELPPHRHARRSRRRRRGWQTTRRQPSRLPFGTRR